MADEIELNVPLLRRRVPNLTVAARNVGLRPATVSNLCSGKIPLGRAEVRTLVALADLAGCSLDELVVRSGAAGVIETGIKVLDLFAPLVRGGTVGIVARPGMGQVTVLSELIRRTRERGFAAVVWRPAGQPRGFEEVIAEANAAGSSLQEVREQVASLGAGRDVLLTADRDIVLTGELLALREQLREAGVRPITVALVDVLGEAPDEEAPYGPLETLWRFDSDLVARALHPAIDPVSSTSTSLEGSQLEAAHHLLQQRARKLLRRYRELRPLVAAFGWEKLPAPDLLAYRRGERLEAFLTQPFYVAEPFTQKPGEWVPLQLTIDGIRRILDGAADELEATTLKYRGEFPHAGD